MTDKPDDTADIIERMAEDSETDKKDGPAEGNDSNGDTSQEGTEFDPHNPDDLGTTENEADVVGEGTASTTSESVTEPSSGDAKDVSSSLPDESGEPRTNTVQSPDSGGSTSTVDPQLTDSDVLQIDDLERRKWFLCGVGGTGGNLIDAVLLRKRTLEDREDDLARVWAGGLQGVSVINTHREEISESYYATEYRQDEPAVDVARNHVIGPSGDAEGLEDILGEAYQTVKRLGFQNGMGNNGTAGAKVAELEFLQDGGDLPDGVDLGTSILESYRGQIQSAQAVMLLHSVVHGTGSGATPTVAEKMKRDIIQPGTSDSSPIYTSVILPSEKNNDYHRLGESNFTGGATMRNAILGLARLSGSVDVILPFSNHSLANTPVTVDIDDSSIYFNNYQKENQALVAFLEAFSMSSIPGSSAEDAVATGSQFDVTDPFGPLIDWNPCNFSHEVRPASIVAPALGRLKRSNPDSFGKKELTKLVDRTFATGKLGEFDESTCWGGSFLFYYPEHLHGQVENVVEQYFVDIVKNENIFDLTSLPPGVNIDISRSNMYFVSVKNCEDVHLWAGLWNPKLPQLEDYYEWAQIQLSLGGERADRLQEFETEIENLRRQLGREPLIQQADNSDL